MKMLKKSLLWGLCALIGAFILLYYWEAPEWKKFSFMILLGLLFLAWEYDKTLQKRHEDIVYRLENIDFYARELRSDLNEVWMKLEVLDYEDLPKDEDSA